MKYIALTFALFYNVHVLFAQSKYPEPEFTNEVYYLKKDSVYSIIRLEKESSKMETKTKMGGMAGAENGYSIDDPHSDVRLNAGHSLSFIFYTGEKNMSTSSSPSSDSMLRANGMDPALMQNFNKGSDPSNLISLYKLESQKDMRKLLLMKTGGVMPFSSKKMKSSDKFTFSVKKIKDGYWELVVDKTLPKGEYAFTMTGQPGMGGMDMALTIFAFGID
jgi:hypothetical protein